jgi:hypothetical protein
MEYAEDTRLLGLIPPNCSDTEAAIGTASPGAGKAVGLTLLLRLA